ncbi:MAG: hypothetical protein K9N47_18890 [Prosthecobacter sp.]|uniref:hypothetical protein n=1 Tax=Prosthecobacter sp. TaxID=1965333 RepID=UPI0025FD71DA|nr:hypothetical protein [Prosthecobacter sp.]MCF7788197.1 hypothetical protein [Prosthecobacter sp.]
MDNSTAAKNSSGESWRNEPIQPKQKAVLEFLKMPVPPTRGGASNLIKAVFEGPAGNSHQNLWEAAKYELHPDLYPPKPKKEIPTPKPPILFGYVVKAVLALAVIFYAMDRYHEYSITQKPAVSPPPVNEPAAAAPTVAVKTDTPPPAPERKPVSAIIPLQSTDGRTVQAKILALTKTTVLIRREDGRTFDLPLDQLTADSKQRIEEYRTAKRTGLVK